MVRAPDNWHNEARPRAFCAPCADVVQLHIQSFVRPPAVVAGCVSVLTSAERSRIIPDE